MPARMFTQNEFGLVYTDVFRPHDLIGETMLEHPVLVNACFVSKRIRSDNCLVRLDDDACVVAHQFADSGQLLSFDSCLEPKSGGPGFERHNHLFERGISGALPDAIDAYLSLACPGADTCHPLPTGHAPTVPPL